jgi:hypothetical protein
MSVPPSGVPDLISALSSGTVPVDRLLEALARAATA